MLSAFLLFNNIDNLAEAITLSCKIGQDRIQPETPIRAEMIRTLVLLSNRLASKLPAGSAAEFLRILDGIEKNIKLFRQEQKDVFYSTSDAVDEMVTEKRVPARLVKAMLGGKWPKHEFNFDCINYFMLEKDGTLIPGAGDGEPAPGPDFKLKFEMVNDPLL
jgi:hypothetical protein